MTGRAQGRRGDIRPAVVVHHDTDCDIDRRHGGLAQDQRSSVETRVLHLGLDVEVGGNATKGEDQRRHGGDGTGKVGRVGELEVRDPYALLRRSSRPLLDADSDGEDKDWLGHVSKSLDQ